MFKLLKTENKARRGEFITPHGTVQTPAFMNVATCGAIKGAVSHLRPGDGTVKALGGLHRFTRWEGPILTDSGGFQVFSLAKLRNIKEEGVTFNSHIDGRKIFMGPEESMTIQSNLGSTIAMAFDECVENPAEYSYAKDSVARTTRWLKRCITKMAELNSLEETINKEQMLFGINQGATFPDLRIAHMQEIAELDLDGYAIGGLAVGEPTEHRGIDLFDCVMPSRNARHGQLFTWDGVRNLNNAKYALDPAPIDERCDCPVCRNFSRAYVRHLLKSGEMLGMRLAVMHNLWFYNTLMETIRKKLDEGVFEDFYAKQREILGVRI